MVKYLYVHLFLEKLLLCRVKHGQLPHKNLLNLHRNFKFKNGKFEVYENIQILENGIQKQCLFFEWHNN